jgi:hypothetical protein
MLSKTDGGLATIYGLTKPLAVLVQAGFDAISLLKDQE